MLIQIIARYLQIPEERAEKLIKLISMEKRWQEIFTVKGIEYKLSNVKTQADFIGFLEALGQSTWFKGHDRSTLNGPLLQQEEKELYFDLFSGLGLIQNMELIDSPDFSVVLGSSEAEVETRVETLKQTILSGCIPKTGQIFGLGCNRQLGVSVQQTEEKSKFALLAASQETTEMGMVSLITQECLAAIVKKDSRLTNLSYQAIDTTSNAKTREDGSCVKTADTAASLKEAIEQQFDLQTMPLPIQVAVFSTQPFVLRQQRDVQQKLGSNYRVIGVGVERTKEAFLAHPQSVGIFLGEVARLLHIQYTPDYIKQFDVLLTQDELNELQYLSEGSPVKEKGVKAFSEQRSFFNTIPSNAITAYYEKNYPGLPRKNEVPAEIWTQLTWVELNSVITTQSNVLLNTSTDINQETKRCLARFNCLYLLKKGDEQAYSQFISTQLTCQLTWDKFKVLSDIVNALPIGGYVALEASCFITKSDKAIRAAAEAGLTPSEDSEQFITDLISHRTKTIYPACQNLTPEALEQMRFVFFRGAHARHMLDMEGGQNMYASLREAIRYNQISTEQMNLWLSRWIINIAGLDGHIQSQGSSYLTETVAEVILDLKQQLDSLLDNSNHNVLESYLTARAVRLGVSSPYLAHLGTLMRRYGPEDGKKIQDWFNALEPSQQNKHIQKFEERMQTMQVTPTFKPVLLDNLLKLLDGSIAKALTMFHEIEQAAERAYRQEIENGSILVQTPLRYRDVASSNSLKLLLNFYSNNKQLPLILVNSTGSIQEITQAHCDYVVDQQDMVSNEPLALN
ncbi:MAG: hypothetical protein Q8R83_07385 [Legionellaceae bacterium]|nr:hypothetical protein [Legionellaceae bacterium]